jgi:cGMP-dependent protein kinase
LSLNREKFNLLLGPVQEQLAKRMRVRILQSVPLLSKLPEAKLSRLSGVMRVQAFKPGACIIRQGETGSRFYIINEGEVRCTRVTGQKEDELTRLHPQEFFGERALITNEPRKANVIAVGNVECLVLERSNFVALLNEVQDQLSGVVNERDGSTEKEEVASGPVTDFKFEDLNILRTIGTGTFGRVKLVQHVPSGRACALKTMNKADVVASHQETNIMAEKNLLFLCSGSPFVLSLLQTFNFPNQIFMLMEFIQGGELWTYIYEKTNTVERNAAGGFVISAAKFYAANVILAFRHLHSKNIAYRDLKPENLLIDGKGYVKMIDFGFAKQFPYIKNGKKLNKTFTLCGTPEYLAPEIVHSKGYDKSVDCWALGCLIFELFLARTPFQADYTTKIFQNIVNSDKILKLPDAMDSAQKTLIKKLLHTNPAFRMGNLSGGIDDIMRDPYFSGTDWNALVQGATAAPYKPPVSSDMDSTNFDKYDEESDIPPYTGKQDVFADF